MTWLAVFIGGGAGSLMRYITYQAVNKFWSHSFPLATLISNLAACIILAVSVSLLREKIQHNEIWYAFLVIGICGGYSTFSTFAKENGDLLQNGNYLVFTLNVLISLALCIGVVLLVRK